MTNENKAKNKKLIDLKNFLWYFIIIGNKNETYGGI